MDMICYFLYLWRFFPTERLTTQSDARLYLVYSQSVGVDFAGFVRRAGMAT